MKMNNKFLKPGILYMVAMALPALICLFFICGYGVNVPAFDEWGMVGLAQKIAAGDATWHDFMLQQNEHKLPVAKMMYMGVAYLSGFNSVAAMLLSFAMILCVAAIITFYISKQNNIPVKYRYFYILLTSFLMFTLQQYENLLWGFQIGFVAVLFFAVLAFYFLYLFLNAEGKRRNVYFIAALLCAFLDSFSHSHGLLSWVTGMLLLLLVQFQRKSFKWVYPVVWGLAAVVTFALYFYDYVKPEHHPSLLFVLQEPMIFCHYLFSIMGNAIVGIATGLTTLLGVLLSIILLFVLIAVLRKKNVKDLFFPLAITLNSSLIIGSIAVGRAGFGVEQSLASRYVTFSVFIVIGVFLVLIEMSDKSYWKKIRVLFSVILLISVLSTLTNGFRQAGQLKLGRQYAAYVLETANRQQPDQFIESQLFGSSVSQNIGKTTFMEEHKYSTFAHPHYVVPEIVHNDAAARPNNDLFILQQNTLQFAPDFMVVVRPVVKPQYKGQIKSLYVDVNGKIFPLYVDPEKATMPANPQSIYDVSAIAFNVLPEGLLHVKFKALTADTSFYYEVDAGWQFERP